jgi:hypothetical protein
MFAQTVFVMFSFDVRSLLQHIKGEVRDGGLANKACLQRFVCKMNSSKQTSVRCGSAVNFV